MTRFQGEYESTVDSKNRFLMPVAVKKQLPAEESVFVISRGTGKYLRLYPQSAWDNYLDKISGLNDGDPLVEKYKQFELRGSTPITLDGSGRFNLPATLKSYAGIDKDIILFGVLTHYQIWDATKYNTMFDDTSADEIAAIKTAVIEKYNLNFNK